MKDRGNLSRSGQGVLCTSQFTLNALRVEDPGALGRRPRASNRAAQAAATADLHASAALCNLAASQQGRGRCVVAVPNVQAGVHGGDADGAG
jgi:hypothetical protein